jgi:hypothetical protein
MSSTIFKEIVQKELEEISEEWSVERALNFKLNIGKFKGETLEKVLQNPEGGIEYIRWLATWPEARREQSAAAITLLCEYQKERKRALGEPPKKRKKKSAPTST